MVRALDSGKIPPSLAGEPSPRGEDPESAHVLDSKPPHFLRGRAPARAGDTPGPAAGERHVPPGASSSVSTTSVRRYTGEGCRWERCHRRVILALWPSRQTLDVEAASISAWSAIAWTMLPFRVRRMMGSVILHAVMASSGERAASGSRRDD